MYYIHRKSREIKWDALYIFSYKKKKKKETKRKKKENKENKEVKRIMSNMSFAIVLI